MNKEIEDFEKNNKLFSEFIGLVLLDYKSLNDEDLWETTEHLMNFPDSTLMCSVPFDMTPMFHISWDCIMAIVDKIRSLGVDVTISNKRTSITDNKTFRCQHNISDKVKENTERCISGVWHKTSFLATYHCALDFINWYNKQKEDEKI